MDIDLVHRLRQDAQGWLEASHTVTGPFIAALESDAADEIERLRAELKTTRNTALINLAAARNQRLETERLTTALNWIGEQRWNENADLDEICTRAERSLAPDTNDVS